MWFYETKIGIFTIRERSGKYHVYFDGEDLGSYDTPWQASEDLAGGRMPTLSCGVDTATLGIPPHTDQWFKIIHGIPLGKKTAQHRQSGEKSQ